MQRRNFIKNTTLSAIASSNTGIVLFKNTGENEISVLKKDY